MSVPEVQEKSRERTSRFDFDVSAPSFYSQSMLESMYQKCGIITVDCRYCGTGCIIRDDSIATRIRDLLTLAGITKIPQKEEHVEIIDGVATQVKIRDYTQYLRDWIIANVIDTATHVRTKDWLSSIGKEGTLMGEFFGFDPSFEFVTPSMYSSGGNLFYSKPKRKTVSFSWPQPRVLLCIFSLFAKKTLASCSFSFGIHSEPHGHGN